MQRGVRNRLALIALIGLSIVVAYVAYVLRPTAAPSGEISAVAIEISTATLTELDVLSKTSQDLSNGETPEMIQTEQIIETESSISGTRIYEIEQSGSTASFTINEILRGVDATVIGVTDQVAGQILIDFDNPASSQMGLVQVNARTLVTNSENRNRAIRNEILDVDEYEFISFEPTLMHGLPEQVEIGKSYEITIRGNLSIRDFTNEEIFQAIITIDSETQISGQASTVIQRSEYGLTIPQVLAVAGVEESVIVEINFVAVAQ